MPRIRALLGVTAAVGGLILVPAVSASAATTLLVGNPAKCGTVDYTTISAAVAAAEPGDTIQVCAGVFAEQVVIDKPNLTLEGAQAGNSAVSNQSGPASLVSDPDGVFVLTANANSTTIDGFTIQGARNNNADGVADFAGSSGLTLVNDIVQDNSNGLNVQNPDGTKPALIARDKFANNNAGGSPGSNAQTGTGVFISNGPANNTQITGNKFTKDSQTAINFAGDSTNPSVGLQVTDNQSVNDATFVVATNSTGALIEDNVVTTSANVPGGGHGTGILDFGANSNLRIGHNNMSATGATSSSGISVSNYAGSSQYTTVVGNSISGWYNDLKVVTGNTTAYISDNALKYAQNDGIIAQPGTSSIVFTHNTVSTATLYSCEDQTTGSGTAGTANIWSKNTATSASSPVGICKVSGTS